MIQGASGSCCVAPRGAVRGTPWIAGFWAAAPAAAAFSIAILLGACSDLGALVESQPQRACSDSGTICTVVGTGERAFNGEGAPALQEALYYPIDLTFDAQQRLLVLDWNNQRIRRLDVDGRLRTIMGNGNEGPVVEGAPALQTTLHHAFSFAYDAAGNLYIAGNHQPQVLKVDSGQLVHIFAGSATVGYSGDGGPATQAELDAPTGVAVDPGGTNVFVVDNARSCVRAIDAAGIITTLCGNGAPGYAGDGGPAAQAQLRHPYRVRYHAPTGSLYVCDTENHAVRRIDANGIITTVAGTGEQGFSGDGGPAAQARLTLPYDAVIGPDGALYIADTGNQRIRRVSAGGVITTFAGTGVRGYAGEQVDALSAGFNQPAALGFDAAGDLWVADMQSSRVRRIAH
jgi:DNA-binding beta-propeller fold protein YncE